MQIVAKLNGHVIFPEQGKRFAERFADEPLAAVAVHCPRCSLSSCDDAKPCVSGAVRPGAKNKITACYASAGAENRLKVAASPKNDTTPWNTLFIPFDASTIDFALTQTASRARPFARRALMTARPAFVFMRTRNPCVRLRRVLDG